MRGFEVIRKEGRWRFRFIPGNNNGQPVGESKEYDSYDECLRAVKQLRGLIVENRIDTIDSPFVRVVKGERKAQVEYHLNGEVLFQTRTYDGKSAMANCRNAVLSIYRHIAEYSMQQI